MRLGELMRSGIINDQFYLRIRSADSYIKPTPLNKYDEYNQYTSYNVVSIMPHDANTYVIEIEAATKLSIWDLAIDVPTANKLAREGIVDVNELLNISTVEFLTLNHVGKKELRHIIVALHEKDMYLNNEIEDLYRKGRI